MTDKQILLTAIRTYGEEAQLKVLLEEMSELQKEICKFWRGRKNTREIAEEIADVEIMLEQAKIIFGCRGDADTCRRYKLDRLYNILCLVASQDDDRNGRG